MRGRTVKVPWQGRNVEAYVPPLVSRLAPALTPRTIRQTERAAAAVVRLGDREAAGLGPAARLLLRSEGLASSFIEGVRASVADVAVAEADEAIGGAPGWVADNLAAVGEALGDRGPLTAGALKRWHRRLMRNSGLEPNLIGRWRDRQGWIGGASPLVAAYVPPPAERIDRLMSDLIAFAGREDLDPITLAAVLHAQFETIHPFADGNGRVGRILIAWTLKRRMRVPVPPPVSVQFARDIGGYLSGLTMYRRGAIDRWVGWFAGEVERAAAVSGGTLESVEELRADWRRRLADVRRDAAAVRIVDHLIEHPVMNAGVVAGLLHVSEQAGRAALNLLGARGIVSEVRIQPAERVRPGRPHRWWVAGELLGLLGR
ncbi:MAG: Fic family protein [Acidobacteria bacterium]|nr:Fic family protein [Acidobacteriota bacterium]